MNDVDNCNYCGEPINEDITRINFHIDGQLDESGDNTLILLISLCSEECLNKTLDLGSRILDYGCMPEECFKQLISE